MTSGFPVQSGRQFGSPTLRHTDYCLHPVGRGFELPGINRVRLRDRHRSQHAGSSPQAVQSPPRAPIRCISVITASRRPHTQAAATAGRHTGLHTLLEILGCKNPRIPEHQRLGDGRVGLARESTPGRHGNAARTTTSHASTRSTYPTEHPRPTHTGWSKRRARPRHDTHGQPIPARH